MTAEQISYIAGVVLSLGFAYIPKLKDWFGKQLPDTKRRILLGVLFLVVAAIYGLGCLGRYDYLTCDIPGIWDGVELFIKAAIANQAAYMLTPNKNSKEYEYEEPR